MPTYERWLVISSEGEVKVTKRYPNYTRRDEFIFSLKINVPKPASAYRGSLEVALPEPAEPSAEAPEPDEALDEGNSDE